MCLTVLDSVSLKFFFLEVLFIFSTSSYYLFSCFLYIDHSTPRMEWLLRKHRSQKWLLAQNGCHAKFRKTFAGRVWDVLWKKPRHLISRISKQKFVGKLWQQISQWNRKFILGNALHWTPLVFNWQSIKPVQWRRESVEFEPIHKIPFKYPQHAITPTLKGKYNINQDFVIQEPDL